MEQFHIRWNDSSCVDEFAQKDAQSFFASETHFIEMIAGNVRSVLDVGCASGRFIELLRHYRNDFAYTGIDIGSANIDNARHIYPAAEFHHRDALLFETERRYDLVNATGVMQHEPRFEQLLRRMVQWSERYVLFDVKLAALQQHLIDIDRSHAGLEHRLYFIPLSPSRLMETLRNLGGIRRIAVYGYPTAVNANVRLPADVGQIVSAGVLLELGEAESAIEEIHLPQFLAPWL